MRSVSSGGKIWNRRPSDHSGDLNIIGNTALTNELLRVSQLLEMQHQVSQDLGDESFEIRVDLPGRITHSNSSLMERAFSSGNTLARISPRMTSFSKPPACTLPVRIAGT